MLGKIKNWASSAKEKLVGKDSSMERWFGIYMAFNTKGLFPMDDKVQNTADKIIKDAWNGDMKEARKWAQNLQLYVQDEYQGAAPRSEMDSWFESFKQLWRSGGEEAIKQEIEEETDIELKKEGE